MNVQKDEAEFALYVVKTNLGALPRKPASLACPGDDVLGVESLFEEVAHLLHVGGGVFEEVLVSLTQGVESLLATACGGKTVFGTLATASEEVFTLAAIGWQRVTFLYAKAK